MSSTFENKLVIGLSPSALFREDMRPGPAFPLVKALNALKRVTDTEVEVMLFTRDNRATTLGFFRVVVNHGLNVVRVAPIEGEPIAPYLDAIDCDLLLTDNWEDAQAAINAGHCAAHIQPETTVKSKQPKELRLAFDADAVIFNDEELITIGGLEAFAEHERLNADVPMPDGPFAKLFAKLCRIRDMREDCPMPIKLAVITSRGAPSDERIVNSFKSRQAEPDELFFMDGGEKAPTVEEFAPLVYFDDMQRHVEAAAKFVPSARVPYKQK